MQPTDDERGPDVPGPTETLGSLSRESSIPRRGFNGGTLTDSAWCVKGITRDPPPPPKGIQNLTSIFPVDGDLDRMPSRGMPGEGVE